MPILMLREPAAHVFVTAGTAALKEARAIFVQQDRHHRGITSLAQTALQANMVVAPVFRVQTVQLNTRRHQLAAPLCRAVCVPRELD